MADVASLIPFVDCDTSESDGEGIEELMISVGVVILKVVICIMVS